MTVGGSTKGRVAKESSNSRPQNFFRATRKARDTPARKASRVEMQATFRVSPRGVRE